MFLLKDESYFVPCVEFILETPFGACANIGGAICLWPFIMLCTINASFDFLQLLQFWNDPSLWDPNISPDARSTLGVSRNLVLGLVPWLVGSCLSQFWAANICWRIYRELRLTGYGDIMGDGPGGNFLGGGLGGLDEFERANNTDRGADGTNPPQAPYVAFSGQGHRLD